MMRRPPRSTLSSSSAASDVYKRQPKTLVDQCFSHVEASEGLLVLGSSLRVMSGYRFVRRAADNGIPVAIVTRGPSRGDDKATIRLETPLGVTLSRIVQDLQT